ncbi:RNA 2'-phosphotransferase [Paenibacillus sp. FSL H8-0537]|uniref:RNA 2'-phosphotransferase n=1 Tax=Paenibacillus sp. FSL H8-0537 TaxID=2921399 RepID=UPI00310168BF
MLTDKREKSLSKMMTKILRHAPEKFGILLDEADGSCLLSELLAAINRQPDWSSITEAHILYVVERSSKQRFELADGRIRARYGHSVQKVSYPAAVPPEILYHGTNEAVVAAILREGIQAMGRQYCHLSEGLDFAALAGSRKGKLVMLEVDTQLAAEHGVIFYYAGNEVWLAEAIPAECCRIYDFPIEAGKS